MRIDISLLPVLAAAFMLAFARIGAMVMLMPGLGEANIPVRIKLSIALLLTLIILPLHRSAYHIDMESMSALVVLMIAITGVSPKTVILARGLNTIMGGTLALAAYVAWPTWERTQVGEMMRISSRIIGG